MEITTRVCVKRLVHPDEALVMYVGCDSMRAHYRRRYLSTTKRGKLLLSVLDLMGVKMVMLSLNEYASMVRGTKS